MIDKYYIELINKDIDGLISEVEKKKLNNFLEENNSALEYYTDLKKTVDHLNEMKTPDPQPYLKTRIINSLDFNKYQSKPKKSYFSFPAYFSNKKLSFSFTFALGVIAGLLIYSLISNVNFNGQLPEKNVYGTIGLEGAIKNIETLSIDVSDVHGKINFNQSGDFYELSVNLNSDDLCSVDVRFNSSKTELSGYLPFSDDDLNVTLSENFVRISANHNHKYNLLFSNKKMTAAGFEIEILKSGKSVYKNQLENSL